MEEQNNSKKYSVCDFDPRKCIIKGNIKDTKPLGIAVASVERLKKNAPQKEEVKNVESVEQVIKEPKQEEVAVGVSNDFITEQQENPLMNDMVAPIKPEEPKLDVPQMEPVVASEPEGVDPNLFVDNAQNEEVTQESMEETLSAEIVDSVEENAQKDVTPAIKGGEKVEEPVQIQEDSGLASDDQLIKDAQQAAELVLNRAQEEINNIFRVLNEEMLKRANGIEKTIENGTKAIDEAAHGNVMSFQSPEQAQSEQQSIGM